MDNRDVILRREISRWQATEDFGFLLMAGVALVGIATSAVSKMLLQRSRRIL